MPSIKYSAIAAGALVSVAAGLCPISAEAARVGVAVSGEAAVLIREGGSFYYRPTATGAALEVEAEGPVLCANTGTPVMENATFAPKYNNSLWQLPIAMDVRELGYGVGQGGRLAINQTNTPSGTLSVVDSSLVCHPVNAAGHPPSPYFDGLFRATFDDLPFDNTLPANDTHELLTAWVAGTANCTDPGGKCMLTQRYTAAGVDTLAYMFRFHADSPQANFYPIPITVRDAFHGHFLSASGDYCLVSRLPTSDELDTICDSQIGDNGVTFKDTIPTVVADRENGNINVSFDLNPTRPSIDRWVVVRRAIVGTLPANPRIYVAAAIFADPLNDTAPVSGVAVRTGDLFVGDDVIFGCYPVGRCGQTFGGH